MKNIVLIAITFLFFSCNSSAQKKETQEKKVYTVSKTDAEWKKRTYRTTILCT